MSSNSVAIGIDVGGTKTLGVAVDTGSVTVIDREEVPSGAEDEAVLEGIVSVAGSLLERSRRDPVVRVEGIGVGLAGFVGLDGIVHRAPNAPGLVGRDIAGRLRRETGLRVVVDNDANCVAVAAHTVELPGARHLIALTFGTGIGGGLIVDGKLVRGAHGFAGEPGHMVVDPDGPLCPCGQHGCWERFASGKGLARLAAEAVASGRAPSLARAAGSGEVKGEHVSALAAAGDPAAEAVLDRYSGYVALGVANLVLLLDPEAVVLGGGLSDPEVRLVERVRSQLEERFGAAVSDRNLSVVPSPGGPEAGALGAALLLGHP